MKPFDLERALAGEPVVTRDGRRVTQLTRFYVTTGDPLKGVLHRSEDNRATFSWHLNGKYYGPKHADPLDLFMAPLDTIRQIRIFKSEEKVWGSDAYSEEEWHAKFGPIEDSLAIAIATFDTATGKLITWRTQHD